MLKTYAFLATCNFWLLAMSHVTCVCMCNGLEKITWISSEENYARDFNEGIRKRT